MAMSACVIPRASVDSAARSCPKAALKVRKSPSEKLPRGDAALGRSKVRDRNSAAMASTGKVSMTTCSKAS